MGAGYGDIEELTREDIARTEAAAYHCGARAVDACIRSLSAAEPEFHDELAVRGVADPVGLGCDKGLVVYKVKYCGFDELSLYDGSDNAHKRLIGVDDGALLHGVDFAREVKISEQIEEAFIEKL